MDIEFIYAAPFYISFLLDALEAPARKRKKLLADGVPRSVYLERTMAAGWHSSPHAVAISLNGGGCA